MNSEENRMPMSTVQIISAAFAIVFLILFMWVGGFGFIGAFFLGLLVGIVVFVILIFMFTGDNASGSASGTSAAHGGSNEPAGAATGSDTTAASATTDKAAGSGATAGSDASDAATATTAGAADATKPGSGASKGADSGEPKTEATRVPATAAKPKAAKAKPAAAAKPAKAASASGGEDFDKDGVLEDANEGSKPETLSGPRDGGADNLKEIKGVGPAMEKLLQSLGFYHFDQVAKWTPDEVAWVNTNLGGFKGRATRDDWVAQAKILASGGETAFSKKVDKGGVY